MLQPSLFDSGPQVLLDNALGRIAYHPGCIDGGTAQAWFAALRDATQWISERRMMYDREVDVPRLVARYELADAALPDVLAHAAAAVRRTLDWPFNHVGLNFYRDGQDSVAPHNDKLNDLVDGAPIALLSIGGTRRMTIRTKSQPRQAFDLDLAPGSLLIMSYATQHHLDHGIPKTRDPAEPRISLAFRQRKSAIG